MIYNLLRYIITGMDDIKELTTMYNFSKHKYLKLEHINHKQDGGRCSCKQRTIINTVDPNPKVNIGILPKKLKELLSVIDSASLIFGIGNVEKDDVTRIKIMQGIKSPTDLLNPIHSEFKELLTGQHIITISSNTTYDYLDTIDITNITDPLHISISLDFNDKDELAELLLYTKSKINIILFDGSTTKFLSWHKTIVNDYIINFLKPSGKFYFPVEIIMSFLSGRDYTNTSNEPDDEFYILENSLDYSWASSNQSNGSNKIFVYKIFRTVPSITTSINKNSRAVVSGAGDKIPIFYSKITPLTVVNNIINRLDSTLTKDDYMLFPFDETKHDPNGTVHRLYIYQTVCDIIHENKRFFRSTDFKGVDYIKYSPLQNSRYPNIAKACIVLSKELSDNTYLSDIIPKCEYLTKLPPF